jgi:hypothetical protein
MLLYEGWRIEKGEGTGISILQLLARADSEYKHLIQLGQWTMKKRASDLMGLQSNLTHSRYSLWH